MKDLAEDDSNTLSLVSLDYLPDRGECVEALGGGPWQTLLYHLLLEISGCHVHGQGLASLQIRVVTWYVTMRSYRSLLCEPLHWLGGCLDRLRR
jgi:hypothetical protein